MGGDRLTYLTFFEFYKRMSPNFKASMIIIAFLILLVIDIGIRVKYADPNKPSKGIVLLAETLVSWINDMCITNHGKYWKRYAPYILTMAIFIFVSNISGLFGFASPTANVAITVALGVIAGFRIQFASIRTVGFKNYLKSFLEPTPIMLPLNIISEIVTPFSLGLRLFGNILSGGVILSLIYNTLLMIKIGWFPLGGILSTIITPAFHAIFDIFFGAIQTYVFILLVTVFISGKLPEEDV